MNGRASILYSRCPGSKRSRHGKTIRLSPKTQCLYELRILEVSMKAFTYDKVCCYCPFLRDSTATMFKKESIVKRIRLMFGKPLIQCCWIFQN